eukprot:383999_1
MGKFISKVVEWVIVKPIKWVITGVSRTVYYIRGMLGILIAGPLILCGMDPNTAAHLADVILNISLGVGIGAIFGPIGMIIGGAIGFLGSVGTYALERAHTHYGSHKISLLCDDISAKTYIHQAYGYKNPVLHPILAELSGLAYISFNATHTLICNQAAYPVYHEFVVIKYATISNTGNHMAAATWHPFKYLTLKLNKTQGGIIGNVFDSIDEAKYDGAERVSIGGVVLGGRKRAIDCIETFCFNPNFDPEHGVPFRKLMQKIVDTPAYYDLFNYNCKHFVEKVAYMIVCMFDDDYD